MQSNKFAVLDFIVFYFVLAFELNDAVSSDIENTASIHHPQYLPHLMFYVSEKT